VRLGWSGHRISGVQDPYTPRIVPYPWRTGYLYASDATGPGTFWAQQTYPWRTASLYASDTGHISGVQCLVRLRLLSALSQPGPTKHIRDVHDFCTPRVLHVAEARSSLYATANLGLTLNPTSLSYLPKQPQHSFPPPISNSPSSPPYFSHIYHSF
jgi:hypothetical protein